MSATLTARRVAPPAVRAWWRDAAGLTAWLSLLFVVALWVSGHGLQDLTTDFFTSTGRLTGLLSADLLLLQLLLMARIPWVERSYGQDELARRHRITGFTSISLLAAHLVLITLGYAAADRSGVLAEAWNLVTTYPGMLLAAAGTAALVMVAVTSVRAARRRLRYESWHLLHLYAYLGTGLALPHQLWTGADFTASPVATVFWWTAYAAAAGAVLVFRVGRPVWLNFRHRLVVEQVVPEGRGVVSVYLRGRDLDRLPVAAGQFFVWRFRSGPGWTRGKPFSLSAAPDGHRLRITAKDLGPGSRRLATLRPGTPALFEGPYGRLTGTVLKGHKVALFASGIGITPLRALLDELPYHPGEAVLFQRAGRPADLLFRREIEDLAARRGIRLHYLLGRRSRDRTSWLPAGYAPVPDEQVLRHLVPDIADHDVYVCGPDAWTAAVLDSARRAGVPADRIHAERFAW
ncbi:ferric reductase-like transmembrane domain-containing protein [Amycolatopsis mediterranei]|uniref:Oxidoreductase n=2 Tax=Amycolatopsis mediterranei TaxID=33910 RepID=A0A0H3D5D7_AMYMU|nr:ferric reductase-like transmembrane domain-containing protein [Amycolatopsis mediterranei]ADJ45472.1 oxidoreductase [Amycolatopsis mediterranei U32]AGT84312.1 oxidoreductase [Amycolatopsis mediterranei RB]KDO06052.1 oxidoreductase [Amycolatopsis mediterranei]KDU88807.1 oxidoreductase [Amycolatopsis mediterranei]UZF70684.1 ferredoxin reductase family protein [Amycolatopsis mediterranei]